MSSSVPPTPEILDWCRRVFGASTDPYALLDSEGRYLWFNDAGTALFGYTPEEVIGTHFRDHLVQGEPQGAVFTQAIAGVAGGVVRHVRRKDGAIAPVKAELLLAADGMILVHATDLREMFTDVRQLRSNTVLQALLSSSPDGIWLMDAGLRLAQVNQRAADLMRSVNGKEPVIGTTFDEGNAPDAIRDLVRQLGTAAAAGRHSESVQRLTDVHGLTRFFQFNVFPLTASDNGRSSVSPSPSVKSRNRSRPSSWRGSGSTCSRARSPSPRLGPGFTGSTTDAMNGPTGSSASLACRSKTSLTSMPTSVESIPTTAGAS